MQFQPHDFCDIHFGVVKEVYLFQHTQQFGLEQFFLEFWIEKDIFQLFGEATFLQQCFYHCIFFHFCKEKSTTPQL